MAWRENSNLYLNTQDIALVDANNFNSLANVENERGGWVNNRQVFWFNVDFKKILGDLYDKYDAFQISALAEDILFPEGITGTLGPDNHWNFMMSGLDFLQCGYNQKTRSNTTDAFIRFHNQMQNTGQRYSTATGAERDAFGVTFRKPNQYVRLTFYHTSLEEILPPGTYGIMVLQFNIRPCSKPSLFAHNLNGHSVRLNLGTPQISDDFYALRVSNTIGSWEPITPNGQARQRFSFNINMKTLLGHQWERYDRFVLAAEGFNLFAPVGVFYQNRTFQFYMRGLNFRNTYLQRNDSPSGSVMVSFWNFGTAAFDSGDKDSRVFPFVKQDANVKLEFDVYDYLRNVPLESNAVNTSTPLPLPNFLFNFLIMPLQ
jgi:hypothetical protein